MAASAFSRHGFEAAKATIYEVNGTGTGSIHLSGVYRGSGNLADEPSLPTDPANSNRALIAVPQGTFTVLNTGGTDLGPYFGSNCQVTLIVKGQSSTIVAGTGLFANATGTFKGNIVVIGYAARLATGACNESQTTPLQFDTVYVTVRGHLSLGSTTG